MSIPVELAELADAMAVYRFGYVLTIAEDGRPHIVAVRPRAVDGGLVVEGLGRRTAANLAARPAVTLLWPPGDPAGYSLIVDGHAAVTADGSATITPERAVLHRPAPGVADAPEQEAPEVADPAEAASEPAAAPGRAAPEPAVAPGTR